MGIPSRRFGHAAALIIIGAEKDANGIRRQFMYTFGGMGPQCVNGLCSDLWRYEIPWPSAAYYPRLASVAEYNRGNRWFLLNDPNHLCPLGCGRYRHSMIATADNDFIYIFGGEGKGEFFNDLFRYRVMTSMWEKINVFGFVSLTRLAYNTFGKPLLIKLPADEYDPDVDIPSPLLVERCPSCGARYGNKLEYPDTIKLPRPRCDSSMTTFGNESDIYVFGGYRTSWGEAEGMADGGPTDGTFDFHNVDPKALRGLYYLDDQWIYQTESSRWNPLHLKTESPTWRRGHAMATRRKDGKDEIFLYGGRYQDEPLSDIWVFDIGASGDDRAWSRIDITYEGFSPPPSAYHTFIYSEDLDIFILVGGVSWTQTDLTFTDHRRNLDRRCAKNAKDLATKVYDDTLLPDDDPLKNISATILFGGEKFELLKKQVKKKICAAEATASCFLLDEIVRGEDLLKAGLLTDYDTLAWNFRFIITTCLATCPERDDSRECKIAINALVDAVTPRAFMENLSNQCDTYDRCCKTSDEINLELEEYFEELHKLQEDSSHSEKAILINKTKFWFAEPLIVGDLYNVRGAVRLQQWRCALTKFKAEFKPVNSPGVWIFNPNKCPSNELGMCSGRGKCLLSHCVCFTGWSGRLCQQQACPGNLCTVHPGTYEETCIECSQRGRCLNGKCQCDAGYTLDDCGAVDCLHNCSSTPTLQRGACVPEFPAHQCHCFDRYSGLYCEKILCLNQCTGHGACVEGQCICNPMYSGTDCSLFVFQAAATRISISIILFIIQL